VPGNRGRKNEVATAAGKRNAAVDLVTVREAARRLNRPQKSVRKVIDARRIEKHYASGKQRFQIFWEDVERVYREIQTAGR
jgi:hypothetical protein